MFIVKKDLRRKGTLVQVSIVCKNIPFEFIGHAELEEDTDDLLALEVAEKIATYNATKSYKSYLYAKGVEKVVYTEGNEQVSTDDN